MIVREIMTPAPWVVGVTDSLRRVHARLLESDVRHLPVVDRGRLVGIISERDLPSDMITPGARGGGDRGDRVLRVFERACCRMHAQAEQVGERCHAHGFLEPQEERRP